MFGGHLDAMFSDQQAAGGRWQVAGDKWQVWHAEGDRWEVLLSQLLSVVTPNSLCGAHNNPNHHSKIYCEFLGFCFHANFHFSLLTFHFAIRDNWIYGLGDLEQPLSRELCPKLLSRKLCPALPDITRNNQTTKAGFLISLLYSPFTKQPYQSLSSISAAFNQGCISNGLMIVHNTHAMWRRIKIFRLLCNQTGEEPIEINHRTICMWRKCSCYEIRLFDVQL